MKRKDLDLGMLVAIRHSSAQNRKQPVCCIGVVVDMQPWYRYHATSTMIRLDESGMLPSSDPFSKPRPVRAHDKRVAVAVGGVEFMLHSVDGKTDVMQQNRAWLPELVSPTDIFDTWEGYLVQKDKWVNAERLEQEKSDNAIRDSWLEAKNIQKRFASLGVDLPVENATRSNVPEDFKSISLDIEILERIAVLLESK